MNPKDLEKAISLLQQAQTAFRDTEGLYDTALYLLKMGLEILAKMSSKTSDQKVRRIFQNAADLRNALVHGCIKTYNEDVRSYGFAFSQKPLENFIAALQFIQKNHYAPVLCNLQEIKNTPLYNALKDFSNPESLGSLSRTTTFDQHLDFILACMMFSIGLDLSVTDKNKERISATKKSALNSLMCIGESMKQIELFHGETMRIHLSSDSNLNVLGIINIRDDLAHANGDAISLRRLAEIQQKFQENAIQKIAEALHSYRTVQGQEVQIQMASVIQSSHGAFGIRPPHPLGSISSPSPLTPRYASLSSPAPQTEQVFQAISSPRNPHATPEQQKGPQKNQGVKRTGSPILPQSGESSSPAKKIKKTSSETEVKPRSPRPE